MNTEGPDERGRVGKLWDLFLLSIGITPPREAERDKWKETREAKRAEKEASLGAHEREDASTESSDLS